MKHHIRLLTSVCGACGAFMSLVFVVVLLSKPDPQAAFAIKGLWAVGLIGLLGIWIYEVIRRVLEQSGG